jgi:carboxymethylenebutenolidase
MITISIDTGDGAMAAYLALPKGGTGPAVIIIQEIFGVNDFVRTVALHYAALGYVAVAPDLFWRIQPGVELSDQNPDDWKRAFELFQKFDVDKGIADIQQTITAIRAMPDVTGKVGAVGYCLGGKLAYLTATRTDADAAVGYYGVMIDQILGEASSIKKPLILHIAGKDEYVPPPAQAKIHEGLDGLSLVTLYDYPEEDHGFARIGGAHFGADSAALANARTEAFFAEHLK